MQPNHYRCGRLTRLLRQIVEPGKRVLELRCRAGHLLAGMDAAHGVGVDVSHELVTMAQQNYPHLSFVRSDTEALDLGGPFDYIILSQVFDTPDILKAFESVRRHCTTDTRLIVINYNPLWQPILELASKIGLCPPFEQPSWVDEYDLRKFMDLAGFRALRTYRILLLPQKFWLLSSFCNDFLARLPGLRKLCMTQVMVARLQPQEKRKDAISVSVIVPCRNEAGNVQQAVERIPHLGRRTEIIFCDDKSTDDTAAEVRRMQELHPERRILLLNGPGVCKAENVWTGFRAATGDVLIILDGDLAVRPEELPVFFNALVENRGEFIIGNRLVYPIPKAAMKLINRVGNKVFGMVFSFLLDQRIKDTLCGTKALWRKDWPRITKDVGQWGIRDLWGDYDLLLGASKLQLEIIDVPVHYQERVYGVSKMTRVFWNGLRMLRICWEAWRRLPG